MPTALPDRFAQLATPDQVRRFCDERLAAADAARKELVSAKRSVTKALEPFDRISAELDAGANAASLLRSVHPDEAVRKAAEECEQRIADAATKLSLDREVFD